MKVQTLRKILDILNTKILKYLIWLHLYTVALECFKICLSLTNGNKLSTSNTAGGLTNRGADLEQPGSNPLP